MSKKSKARRKDARKAEKSRRKATKAALYKSYSEKGHENKTRRHRKSVDKSGKGQHLMADCGNMGCLRCYPHLNDYLLQNGKTRSAWKQELTALDGKMLPQRPESRFRRLAQIRIKIYQRATASA